MPGRFLVPARHRGQQTSRHVAFGFTTATTLDDAAISTADGLYIESDPTGADNLSYRTLRMGTTRIATALDLTPLGFGSAIYANYNKSMGLRLFLKSGRAVILRQGKIEGGDFSLFPLTMLDQGTTYRPFLFLRRVAATSTERLAKLRSRIAPAVTGSGRPVAPYYPAGLTALVDLNFKQGVFRIGSTALTSLAAFEADSRVTKISTAVYAVNLAEFGALSAATGLSCHTIATLPGTLPGAGANQWMAVLDDGADGVPGDELLSCATLNENGVIYSQSVVNSVAVATTASLVNTARAAGALVSVIGGGKNSYLTSSEVASGTKAVTTGAVSSQLNRLLVGGRDARDRDFVGTLHRVVLYRAALGWDSATFYATRS